jgi:hypothetical protein
VTAQNQKVKGSGFNPKGEVNSPKVEPPKKAVTERSKKYRYIYPDEGSYKGQRLRFKF